MVVVVGRAVDHRHVVAALSWRRRSCWSPGSPPRHRDMVPAAHGGGGVGRAVDHRHVVAAVVGDVDLVGHRVHRHGIGIESRRARWRVRWSRRRSPSRCCCRSWRRRSCWSPGSPPRHRDWFLPPRWSVALVAPSITVTLLLS